MTTRTPTGIILPTFPKRIIKTRSGKQKEVQYKIIAGSLKATNDAQGIVEGYLNAIGNIDFGLDRTKPGAFKRTLDLSYKRKKANGDQFLWPYLWNHDTNLLPPGGIFDAEEDTKGLYIKAQLNLDYQLGRDMYSSYKFGSLKKQSMGYLAHQTDYVREDGQLIRDLIEVEILEGSGVIFPMNDEADVTSVKRQSWTGYSAKTVCGNTSGTLGPRNEKWDGSKAEKQIWEAAYNGDDSKIDEALAKKYFMVLDGDAQKKGSYSYPFWYVGDDPHICVGAVIAIAGAIGGARGASAPDGLKSKVKTLYKRINKKYPNDAQLTPAWEDSGKRGNRRMDKKDFNDEYRVRKISAWQSSFYSWFSALKASIMDAFDQGDDPMGDVQANLNGVDDSQGAIQALLDLIQEGIDLDYSNYLDELQQNNPSGYYDYMARNRASDIKSGDDEKRAHRPLARAKAGAEYSQDNLQMLGEHISDLRDVADAIHQMAEDLAQNTGASTYTDPNGNSDNAKQTDSNKAGSRASVPNRKHSLPDSTAVNDGDLSIGAALVQLGQLTVKK